jgi:hypothetical protein
MAVKIPNDHNIFQMAVKIPNDHNIFQMAIQYSNIIRPKANGAFWYKNTPSCNPDLDMVKISEPHFCSYQINNKNIKGTYLHST